MRYPLFSEIAHGGDPVLTAYEEVYRAGGGGDPLAAAIDAHVRLHGGDPASAQVQIAVRDRLIGALIPQTFNLWQYLERASRETEQYKGYFEEKMDQVAALKAEQIRSKYPGAYRLKGPPGQGGGEDDDAGG